MADKNSRSGGKYTGNHMTLLPIAAFICDEAHKCQFVIKISPSIINSGKGSGHNKRKVKIVDLNNGCILLSITDNIAHQEVYVYTSNSQSTKLRIACKARDNDIKISFSNKMI